MLKNNIKLALTKAIETVGLTIKIDEALAVLGAHEKLLTQEEKAFLDSHGYLPLRDILTSDRVDALKTRFDELVEEEGEKAGLEVHQEKGTQRLANLVNKGAVFEICFTHPRVLAAIAHVLRRDLKLSSLNGRASLPGHGLQGFHADWGSGVEPGDYYVCNSIWLLDDFTRENGATRVVPGSHRSGKHPKDVLDDPMAPHPDEVLLLGKAGTVVVFNAHTWHGGTLNKSQGLRHALHCYFCRRDQKQQTDQKAYIRPETYERLSKTARCILDV